VRAQRGVTPALARSDAITDIVDFAAVRRRVCYALQFIYVHPGERGDATMSAMSSARACAARTQRGAYAVRQARGAGVMRGASAQRAAACAARPNIDVAKRKT